MWQRRRSVFRWYLSQFSTVLHVILHTRQTKNERNAKTVTMATNPLSTMRFHWSLGIFVIIFTRFSLISQSILNRFTCNFAHTIHSRCGDCPKNLVRFDRVFQKLLMWCTETTLFPRRQSAENAGRHWNSTEKVLSPHRTCVTEQLELTRLVARIERVIINTTAT